MPAVIVTFYSNFHFDEVNKAGVFPGLSIFGEEPRTGKRVGGTDPGTFPMNAIYSAFRVKVVSSGGSYRLKLTLAGVEHESGTLPDTANAAMVEAEFSPPFTDPIEPVFEPCGETGGKTDYCVVDGGWIKVIDIGPKEYEIRFYEDSGSKNPTGVSIQALDVALGPVIELVPDWDEKQYVVELEEGCTGVGDPPGGEMNPQRFSAGSLARPKRFSGGRGG